MGKLTVNIAEVVEVENEFSKDGYDGLRIRAKLPQDGNGDFNDIPWAFPLLPKTFRSVPKKGEAVLLFADEEKGIKNCSQRFYIGPIISQEQYNEFSEKEKSTSLMWGNMFSPIKKLSNYLLTKGAYPDSNDISIVGRGKEDIILKYDGNSSEVNIRAGIRSEIPSSNDENLVGNVVFNGVDPSYIQLKYKKGIATKEKFAANSLINIVANRINLMSNLDDSVKDKLGNPEKLVDDSNVDEMMENLHQVPKGDKLVELLELIIGAILHHLHPWAGMEQCGDAQNYINRLIAYDVNSILSDYVRIT